MKPIGVSILTVLACTSSTTLLADDATPILHPVEAACIDYELSGQMQNGTIRRCHRNFAYESFEIQDMTVGFGGFSQSQQQHTITIGSTIYAINLTTNTGTQTTNPMYDQVAAAMQNTDPDDMADAFITAMGFTATGATKTVADTTCNIYNSNMMGTACLTDNGLMLEQSIMGNTQTAVSVSIGDGGSDEDYTLYQTVTISQGPDLSDMPSLQDLMNQGQ